MTRILRIDSVTSSGGAVSIGYTAGNDAVQATPGKTAYSFASKAQLVAAVKALESRLTDEDLVLMAVATAYKSDSTLTLATLQALIGKQVAVRTQTDTVLVRVS